MTLSPLGLSNNRPPVEYFQVPNYVYMAFTRYRNRPINFNVKDFDLLLTNGNVCDLGFTVYSLLSPNLRIGITN